MPDVPSHTPSFLFHTRCTSKQEIGSKIQLESTSNPVVTSAILRNKKMNLLGKVNSEEYKRMKLERFIENEKKKRVFDSINPRDTLPSHYLKALEDASFIRRNFKHCVMVSGVRIKLEKESSGINFELKPSTSCRDLTGLTHLEKLVRTDYEENSYGSSFTTASSLRQVERDPSQEENQIRQPDEYRKLPNTSRAGPVNEEVKKGSKNITSTIKKMEQKSPENEMADEEEITHKILIVGDKPSENPPEEKKVKFSICEEREIISEDDENMSFKSILTDRSNPDNASTSRNDSRLQQTSEIIEEKSIPSSLKNRSILSPANSTIRSSMPDGSTPIQGIVKEPQSARTSTTSKSSLKGSSTMLAAMEIKVHSGSQIEETSASDSTLKEVDIPDRGRSQSLLKRFLRKFSDSDTKSSLVKDYINRELGQESKRPSEGLGAEGTEEAEESTSTRQSFLKRTWEKAKRFSVLGLAASSPEERKRLTDGRVSNAETEVKTKT